MSSERVTDCATAKAARTGSGRHRRPRRSHPEVSAWLGAGALSVGVGAAALAGGSGIAYADAPHAGSGPSKTDSTTGSKVPAAHGTGAVSAPAAGIASGTVHVKTGVASVPSAAAPTASAVTVPAAVAKALHDASPASAVDAASAAVGHPAALAAALKPVADAVRSPAGSASAAVVQTTSVVSPAASVSVSPLHSVLNVVTNALLSLGGLNPTTPTPAQGNLIQLALYSVARWLQDTFNPGGIPTAVGTPTVGTPDPTTGTLTFNPKVFTDATGAPLTYKVTVDPTEGTVSVNSDGMYTFTPTTAERFIVPPGGLTVPIKVIVYNGVQSTAETINATVNPVDLTALPPSIPIASKVATDGVGDPSGLALSPDGRELLVTSPLTSEVSVINTQTDQVGAIIPVLTPDAVAVTPDGLGAYVSSSAGGDVAMVSLLTDGVLPTTIPATGSFLSHDIAVGPDNTPAAGRLYLADISGGSASVMSLATDSVIATIPIGGEAADVALSPNGTHVYVTASNNASAGTVSVINTATDAIAATIPVGTYPTGVAVSPNGADVYVANGNYTVSVISTATDKVTATIQNGTLPSGPYGPVYATNDEVAVSPDGSVVYVTNSNSNTVSVIDTATNTIIATIPTGSNPRGVLVSPDGNTLYVANFGGGSVSVIPV